jgi:hypothetical protein
MTARAMGNSDKEGKGKGGGGKRFGDGNYGGRQQKGQLRQRQEQW